MTVSSSVDKCINAHLEACERELPPSLSYDQWFFFHYYAPFSPLTAAFFPSDHEPYWIQVVKCILIIVLAPLLLLVKIGEALYFDYHKERFKERAIYDVTADLNRGHIYVGGVLQQDIDEVYSGVVRAHGGNVRAAIQFMDLLHQGVTVPQIKDIVPIYPFPEIENRRLYLTNQSQDLFSIHVDLERKDIHVSFTLALKTLDDESRYQTFRRFDFSLYLIPASGIAIKQYTLRREFFK